MNPLGNAPINPIFTNISETLRFAKTYQSPQSFMQEMQKNNPQMFNYINYLAQTIQNPTATAMQMLSQYGISPEQFNALIGQI